MTQTWEISANGSYTSIFYQGPGKSFNKSERRENKPRCHFKSCFKEDKQRFLFIMQGRSLHVDIKNINSEG